MKWMHPCGLLIITHRIVNQVCALNVPLPFKPNSSISWVLCELYNVTSDHDTPALPVSVRAAKFHWHPAIIESLNRTLNGYKRHSTPQNVTMCFTCLWNTYTLTTMTHQIVPRSLTESRVWQKLEKLLTGRNPEQDPALEGRTKTKASRNQPKLVYCGKEINIRLNVGPWTKQKCQYTDTPKKPEHVDSSQVMSAQVSQRSCVQETVKAADVNVSALLPLQPAPPLDDRAALT